MGMRLSKATGEIYGSQEEYLETEVLPAMRRIRRYADANMGDKVFEAVTDVSSLSDAIKKATKSENPGLAREYSKTQDFKELISRNTLEVTPEKAKTLTRTEKRIQRKNRIAYDRTRAKNEKLIFVGRKKNGVIYVYDFKRKKMLKTARYKHL